MPINRDIITSRAGDTDDAAQVFLANATVPLPILQTPPFNFEVPTYGFEGATYEFYTQNTNGISASLNNTKSIIFHFTANTQSLTGVTEMIHSVCRLDYPTFTDIVNNGTGSTLFEDAVSAITNPITTIVSACTGSTFLFLSGHTLDFPVQIKPANSYTQNLLMDKAQYFVDSRFFFPKPVDVTLGDALVISALTNTIESLYIVPTGNTEFLLTSPVLSQISGGTLSGITVAGSFFSYFVPPQKPDIDIIDGAPAVFGPIPTFAPIFSFNNVDDGDLYKLQVNYNTGDTKFTGTTSIFNIAKQEGNAEFIRTFGKILTPNRNFLYRIGNTKELINLFGVKQSITTWSRYESSRTSNDGQFVLSGHTYRSIIGGPPVTGATITITTQATFSNIDLGSDTTTDPSLQSEISAPLGGGVGTQRNVLSDENGLYDFGRINGGTYLVSATHPDYPQTPFVIVTITDTTSVDFLFSIVWGDTTITFLDPYTFI